MHGPAIPSTEPVARAARRATYAVLSLVLVAGVFLGAVVTPTPAGAAAPFGQALGLDGVDDHARIRDNPSLHLGATAGADFTIEAFVDVPDESSGARQVIFSKPGAFALSVDFNTATDDVLVFDVWGSPTASGRRSLSVGHPISAGWHHVAAVFDNQQGLTPDVLAIYWDGERLAVDDTAALEPGIDVSTHALSVGAAGGALPWQGWIDEARLSSTARYTGTHAGSAAPYAPDAATVALWHFDDPVCGTSLADASGHGNDLTALNGAETGRPGAAPTVQFSEPDYPVAEGAGSVVVTVTRTGDTGSSARVRYATVGGTATPGVDHTPVSGTLAFACGEATKTIRVPIASDPNFEPTETIGLVLSDPVGTGLGAPATATVSILDDDAPVLTFSAPAYSVREGAGPAMVTVTRAGDPSVPMGVDYAVTAGSASAGSDFVVASGTLSFAPDEVQKSFPVGIVADTVTEAVETVRLTLSSPTGGALVGSPDAATLRIVDDNQRAVVAFAQQARTVSTRAGVVRLTVTRGGNTAIPATVTYARTGGTATPGDEMVLAGGTLEFAPGQTARTVDLVVIAGTRASARTVVVTLSGPGAGTQLGDPASMTVTLAPHGHASVR